MTLKAITFRLLGYITVCLAVQAQSHDSASLYKNLEPTIVQITTNRGVGSGVLITRDGLILTNRHVVDNASLIEVETMTTTRERVLFRGATLEKVHGSDDLALLRIEPGKHGLRAATLARVEGDVQTGDECYAMGYPYFQDDGRPTLTITKGIVSSSGRQIGEKKFIQIDAAINPGNSGGALVNGRGQVVGITTAKMYHSEAVGLAIPTHGLTMEQFEVVDRRISGFPDQVASEELYLKPSDDRDFSLAEVELPTVAYLAEIIAPVVDFEDAETIEAIDLPTGVTFDPKTRKLEWVIPPFSQPANLKVLFNVTDANGKEDLKIFTLAR